MSKSLNSPCQRHGPTLWRQTYYVTLIILFKHNRRIPDHVLRSVIRRLSIMSALCSVYFTEIVLTVRPLRASFDRTVDL